MDTDGLPLMSDHSRYVSLIIDLPLLLSRDLPASRHVQVETLVLFAESNIVAAPNIYPSTHRSSFTRPCD
jgi:hypothetical protein